MCDSSAVQAESSRLGSVAVFYLLAFGVSWAIEIPQAMAARGMIHIQIPGAIGFISPLAPMLAAILMSRSVGVCRKSGTCSAAC